MSSISTDILKDVQALNKIPAIANLLTVVCHTTGMGFAAVARVTEDKWVACVVDDRIGFGLKPGGELEIKTTICNEIRQHHQAVIIDHVAEDANFVNHHTPLMYGFQSYISIPITLKDGSFFGTLCAIDPAPHVLNTAETVGMFTLFAELIAFHLEAIYNVAEAEYNLLEERATAELREQFIAILGHDLRNPVGAALNAAQVLLRMPLEEREKKLAQIVVNSSYRMKGLIDNILDFARGRMGDGINLTIKVNEPIEEIFEQIITELKLIYPTQSIEVNYNLQESVSCDGVRLAQLFSNLLGNAITHGEKDAPIQVEVKSANGEFELCMINTGDQIPAAAMERLFEPFSRGEIKAGQEGLGLGLYISSAIAKAHGGQLTAASSAEKTCFTLQFPMQKENVFA